MKKSMRDYLLSLPEQIIRGYDEGLRVRLPAGYRKVRNAVFFGMGGSAIGGDIVAELFAEEAGLPFSVVRESGVPSWVNRETLAIVSSYSGDTLETRTAFAEAEKRGAKIIVLTSGGFLGLAARLKKYPLLPVPAGFPPRCAIGYLTFTLLGALEQTGWLSITRRMVHKIARGVQGVKPAEGRRIAARLAGRLAFLYGNSRGTGPVLKRWRAQLAENAKAMASCHFFPEMLHNEIEAWSFPAGFPKKSAAVFFQDPAEPDVWKRKREAVAGLLKKQGAAIVRVTVPGGGLLERIFLLITLGDWVSYELAHLYRTDPIAIPVISRIKNLG